MTKKWLAHGLGLVLVAACAGVESGGEFASGRRALMSGDSAVALTYFEPIAKRDPNYVAPFTSFRESIWTYLGRAQYQTGKFVEAKSSLEKALSQIPNDSIAKLYLALANLRLQSTEKAIPLLCRTFPLRSASGSNPNGSPLSSGNGALPLISQRNPRANLEKPARMTIYWTRLKAFAPRPRNKEESAKAKELKNSPLLSPAFATSWIT